MYITSLKSHFSLSFIWRPQKIGNKKS